MHRTIPSLFVSAALALALAPAAALAETHVGEITKIDRSSKSIEVRGEASQRKLRFFLARGGDVTRDGQAVSFAELRRGDRVALDLLKEGSTTATRIAVVDDSVPSAVGMRE